MQRPHESFFKRLFVIDQCVILSKNMADKNAIEKILSQDDLPIIVISQMLHKTEIKGHHVYKDVWSPEMGEELEVHCEPDNVVDKYAVCLKTKDGKIVGHLKKGKSGRFAKTIFYFLRSHAEAGCTAKISGKRFNLGDGEGLQVPCVLNLEGENKFVNILKEQFVKMKEI